MLGLALLYAAAASAGCDPAEDAAATLERTLTNAEEAWQDADPERFAVEVDRTALAVPCLSTWTPPEQAARLHRAWGLRLYSTEPSASAQSWAAARAAHPTWDMPQDLLPEGHPERALWSNAPLEGATEPLPIPDKGVEVRIDGNKATERPMFRAGLVQVQQDGEITISQVIFPSDPWPSYPSKLPTLPKEGGSKRHAAPLVATTAAGLATAGLWGATAVAHQRFNSNAGLAPDDLEGNKTTLETRRTVHNKLWTGAVSASALTVVTGTWLAVSW